jgi:predicted dehydrogenase
MQGESGRASDDIMPTPVNIAFVGCGDLFEKSFVPRLLRETGRSQFHIAAVCDTDSERRSHFSRLLGCPAYRDFGDVLDIAGLQAVAILTPTNLHVTQATQALQRGLSVYLQKPAVL